MRLVGLSSALLLLLLLLLLAPPRPAAGYSPSENGREVAQYDEDQWRGVTDRICDLITNNLDPEDDKEAAQLAEAMESGILEKLCSAASSTTNDPASTTEPADGTTSTAEPTDGTTSTAEPTDGTTSTAEPTDGTTSTAEPTDGTTSTAEPTDGTTSTTETSTVTDGVTETEGSTTPPLDDLELYEETRNELELIDNILDKFLALVNEETGAAPPAASARRVRGGHGHPAAWWLRGEAARPLESSYSFCVEGADATCIRLETLLEETDGLVDDLRGDVNKWQNSDLRELREQRHELNSTYEQANDDPETFRKSVDVADFTTVISDVQQDVQDGYSAVQEKIEQLNPPSNPGSVALVAVIGSAGGLMIVSIVGAMVYGYVKKSNIKKKLSSPQRKNKDENIPINAFAQDGPGSRPASRANPYSQHPVPAPRSHHYEYAAPHDPRREQVYSESMDGRPQQGLRRTNF